MPRDEQQLQRNVWIEKNSVRLLHLFNTGSIKDLTNLVAGIGIKTAARIYNYRKKYGPIKSFQQLRGIIPYRVFLINKLLML
jgi:DNA uptake protein ComE-like DNA-binding protein